LKKGRRGRNPVVAVRASTLGPFHKIAKKSKPLIFGRLSIHPINYGPASEASS
jgi:hypothetical protein